MRRLQIALAQHIAQALPSMMPPHRRTWAQAMQREIDAAPDAGGALRYALGCLWVAGCTGGLRAGSLAFAIRAGMAISTAGLAVVAAVTCSRMLLGPHSLAISAVHQALLALGAVGIAYAVAAERLVRRGPSALTGVTTAVLIAAAGGLWATTNPSQSRFLHALSLETLGVWSCVALGAVSAIALRRVARSAEKGAELLL